MVLEYQLKSKISHILYRYKQLVHLSQFHPIHKHSHLSIVQFVKERVIRFSLRFVTRGAHYTDRIVSVKRNVKLLFLCYILVRRVLLKRGAHFTGVRETVNSLL